MVLETKVLELTDMKYNYVFFDAGSIKNRKNNTDDYYYICTEDLRHEDGILVVSYPLDWAPYFFHKAHIAHQRLGFPFQEIWYPFYFKNSFKDNKPICFIVYGYYIRPRYLRYLRKKYPDCKIVKIHRDLIDKWRKRNPDYTDNDLCSFFDLTLTYDKNESIIYDIPYFSEIESKIDIDIDENMISSDLFFAGNAKDRLPALLDICRQASKMGIKCDFFLTGVDAGDRELLEGITYSNHGMSYREMLKRTLSSRCILEINQGGAVGYTSRFLEAVIYGKKLITNNMTIKASPFFRTGNIQCFEHVSEIDYGFIIQNDDIVDYRYNNEFSPVHLIKQIEGLLINGKED